jgi:hypothetical protein
MILITKVETVVVDRDIVKMSVDQGYDYVPLSGPLIPIKRFNELIRGKRFINRKRNIDVVIGVTGEVGELLGIQFEAFESLERTCEELQDRIICKTIEAIGYKDKLSAIENSGFFKRLKWLFCGVK